MSEDFHSARHWAWALMGEALTEGSLAVDATMGNGHDTLRMCRQVGGAGRVWAFDIQTQALEATAKRLEEAGMRERATLILDSHARMADYVTEPVDGVMFNLGWLPGQDKSRRTLPESTRAAIDAALTLLKPGALLTVCAYPGHEEGRAERDMLMKWASELDPKRYDAMLRTYLNQPNDPPLLFAVRRRL